MSSPLRVFLGKNAEALSHRSITYHLRSKPHARLLGFSVHGPPEISCLKQWGAWVPRREFLGVHIGHGTSKRTTSLTILSMLSRALGPQSQGSRLCGIPLMRSARRRDHRPGGSTAPTATNHCKNSRQSRRFIYNSSLAGMKKAHPWVGGVQACRGNHNESLASVLGTCRGAHLISFTTCMHPP